MQPISMVALGLALASLAGCVSYTPPLAVTVQRDGDGCRTTVDGQLLTVDELLNRSKKQENRRAILIYGQDTPYRCIGGAIFNMQRGSIRRIDSVPWYGR